MKNNNSTFPTIPIKESILLDLRYELTFVDFSNKKEDEKSSFYILLKLEEWLDYDDGSITEEQIQSLINYLQDTFEPTQTAYIKMIEMIESGNYYSYEGDTK